MPIPLNQLYIDQQRGYKQWAITEIYNGVNGHPGRHVPNIDDTVFDRVNGWYVVNDVDYSTGLSDLDPWSPPVPSLMSGDDLLLGSGPGLVSESFRAFVKNDVLPRTMALDSRLHIYGTSCTYVKAFLGSDISQNGVVISAYYNQSGTYVGENIPLELVASPANNNVAIKTPKVGYVNRPLAENELITIVAYDSLGGARSQAHLLVRNTDFVRTTDASALYVESIRVVSAFLSDTDSNRLEYPSNLTNYSAHVMGEVTYNNGSKVLYPCDGTKFSLLGINAYIPSIPGQRVPVILSYHLSEGEFSVLPEMANRTITETYELVTVPANNSYNVKLFAYPKWIDAVIGYRMEYWLYTLERDVPVYVTPWVTLASNSPAFDPTAYGIVQHLTLRLNLNSVDPDLYNDYTHVQNTSVTLVSRGDLSTVPNWTVAYTPGQNPQFGTTAVANINVININTSGISITCGATSEAQWLDILYNRCQPLYHGAPVETNPLVPTHVILKFKNFEHEIAVSQWNSALQLNNDLAQGELLYLRFIRRNGLTDLHVGLAALPVHIV
jgi:hypothetical protein